MVDRDNPLDVAELNIELYGDHQILHIASHGIHVDGDRRHGRGADEDLRLTVDLVGAMPTVPELVFLNSCYNGRIGVNRLAAGLARALIAIGVRAVVAAAGRWGTRRPRRSRSCSTTDDHGRTFGDAVTQARRVRGSRGAQLGCLPVLRRPHIRAARPRRRGRATGAPVSLADLKARLAALATQIADLSQPTHGPEGPTRDGSSCIPNSRSGPTTRGCKHDGGWRLLARRRGNSASSAPLRTGTAASPRLGPVTWRLVRYDSSALDLQQAANCLARAHRRRASRPHSLGATTGDKAREALAEFPQAVPPCRRVDRHAFGGRRAAILASVYKKWATVDAREQHTSDADVNAHTKLQSEDNAGEYGVENRSRWPPSSTQLGGARRLSSRTQTAARHGWIRTRTIVDVRSLRRGTSGAGPRRGPCI